VRTKRPAIVSPKYDFWSIGWNSDGSKIVGAREDSKRNVDVLEIVDARTLEPEQSECVTEGSCVFSLAWNPIQHDIFYAVTNKSSSMLPFVTAIEMHQVTASGIVRLCAVPAHPEPCSYIDIQCDREGKSLLTVSRDKDKDSDDRTDDCVIAIWDIETLCVTESIIDADDYKNLACSIQPKGGLIAVGGLSDIKVSITALLMLALLQSNRDFFPAPQIYDPSASIKMRIDPSVSGIKRSVLATAWSPTEKPLLAYTCKDTRDRDAHLCIASW
jgi:WD40 repeat protein